ncbi:hypothetical protein ACOSQ3_008156 [Xanthoceras sorbifolium]
MARLRLNQDLHKTTQRSSKSPLRRRSRAVHKKSRKEPPGPDRPHQALTPAQTCCKEEQTHSAWRVDSGNSLQMGHSTSTATPLRRDPIMRCPPEEEFNFWRKRKLPNELPAAPQRPGTRRTGMKLQRESHIITTFHRVVSPFIIYHSAKANLSFY